MVFYGFFMDFLHFFYGFNTPLAEVLEWRYSPQYTFNIPYESPTPRAMVEGWTAPEFATVLCFPISPSSQLGRWLEEHSLYRSRPACLQPIQNGLSLAREAVIW